MIMYQQAHTSRYRILQPCHATWRKLFRGKSFFGIVYNLVFILTL